MHFKRVPHMAKMEFANWWFTVNLTVVVLQGSRRRDLKIFLLNIVMLMIIQGIGQTLLKENCCMIKSFMYTIEFSVSSTAKHLLNFVFLSWILKLMQPAASWFTTGGHFISLLVTITNTVQMLFLLNRLELYNCENTTLRCICTYIRTRSQ